MRQVLAAATAVGVLVATPLSRAASDPPVLMSSPRLVFARPIGGAPAGSSVHLGPWGGPLLGVDGSWATMLANDRDGSLGSGAFGVRAGWAFANGLAVQLRYDDLGVEPASSPAPLQLATAGLRYSVPFLLPMPFAEVVAGPAFVRGGVQVGAGGGLGVSLPIGPILIDLLGRDWLVPVADSVRQTITVGVGLSVLIPVRGGR